jgi:putative ABC transport system substrate-binding protein
MKEFGWVEGANVRSLFVWAEGHSERAPALAAELVAHNVDVIMAFGEPAVRAAQRATIAIPIVGMADDMIGSGLAAQLSRPGGNTTGLSILTPELDVKRLEMLHELVPQARRIAVLADPTTISTAPQLTNAANRLNVALVWFNAQSPEEIGRGLDAIAVAQVEAVSILGSALMYAARRTIIERMRAEHLPAIYHLAEPRRRERYLPTDHGFNFAISSSSAKLTRSCVDGSRLISQLSSLANSRW